VADHSFHCWREFAECAVIFRHDEQRVVTESAGSVGVCGDHPAARSLRDRHDLAVWIGERGMAGVMGRPRRVWMGCEPREQQGVVGRVAIVPRGGIVA